MLCIALAARVVVLVAEPISPRNACRGVQAAAVAALVTAAALSSVQGWRDVREATRTRAQVVASAYELLDTDLAQRCPSPFVVRSPAVVALTARHLHRPLEDITVAGAAGAGVVLQPLTFDAAEMAGYGPLTPLAEQRLFPHDAPPRDSNTHWALYSSCQP